jgi:pentatricopeptide repeat protein
MLPYPRLVRGAPLRIATSRAAFSARPLGLLGSEADAYASASVAIVRLVAAGGSNLEADLDRLDPALSHRLVTTTHRALTGRGVPAARFFAWVSLRRGFTPSAHAHNLLVLNAGKLADYRAMSRALAVMSERRLSLTGRAFAFLASPRSSGVQEVVATVLKALDDVGGPCRASGVFSLVKALATIGEFGAAAAVIKETTRTAHYYNVLVAAKCKAGDFIGAREVFGEMRKLGYDPDANTWNYLLGCLLKKGRVAEACGLVEAMERLKTGGIPNPLTYEILAYHACKAGKMNSAMRILDEMFLANLTPRITMHTAFIKGYFYAGRIEDACKYVSDMSTRDKHSANRNFSLLAKLLRSSGRVIDAGRILFELMDKGLRPDHSAYVKVAKDLHKMGRGDLAAELKSMFQRFDVHADVGR